MSERVEGRFEIRPAREEDLEEVAGLIQTVDRALGLPLEPIREDLVWTWHLPTTDLGRDTRVVRDGHTVVGYGEATWKHPDDGGPLFLFVWVHPEVKAAGIESWLMSWGEALADERGSDGIRTDSPDVDGQRHDLLRSRGYVHVRSSFTMSKGLELDEDAGTVPPGVEIRRYEDADERALYEVSEASFAEHWGFRPTSLESFNEEIHGEDWDPSLVFLAEANGETVGHVIAFRFESCGYVGSLGVLKEWRGRGIAKALLRRTFAELAARGMREVRLGVDAENAQGAVALYEGVGMTVYRRYDTFDMGTPEAARAATTLSG
jgi:mycothiol synthase